jgi:hypothetical protein
MDSLWIEVARNAHAVQQGKASEYSSKKPRAATNQ